MNRGRILRPSVPEVHPAHNPLRLSNADGFVPRLAAKLNRAAGALLAVVLLSACAGPSKARYVELLHECREANREHLRLVKEYDERTKDCVTLHVGEINWWPKVKPLVRDGEVITCAPWTHPEQAAGAAEMNLGGW